MIGRIDGINYQLQIRAHKIREVQDLKQGRIKESMITKLKKLKKLRFHYHSA